MLYIFDWDGTLCDSTSKIVHAMQVAAKSLGMSALSSESVMNIIGLGLPEAILALYPQISHERSLALQQSYSQMFLKDDKSPSVLFKGVEETLTRLKGDGHILTIATGKSRRGLDRVLGAMGMEGFFQGSRCADETASKPHPKMLHELLHHFSCEPEDSVMVGDTEYDMAMAENAGVPRIAVSYGAHHIDRLQVYQPIMSINEFPQILSFSNKRLRLY